MQGSFDAVQNASIEVYAVYFRRQGEVMGEGIGDLPSPPAGTLYVVSETGEYVVQDGDYVTEEI
jgi:hypothetical protein